MRLLDENSGCPSWAPLLFLWGVGMLPMGTRTVSYFTDDRQRNHGLKCSLFGSVIS